MHIRGSCCQGAITRGGRCLHLSDYLRVMRPRTMGLSFLIFAELVTNILLLYGTRRSITVYTKARQYIIS